jgi:ribosomal protein S18 acetylase RimI-like enzyme
MIQRIEKISMNAWPALETVHFDGWVIRFAQGLTKRSNSVNPIYDSKLDINFKIDHCENLYRSRDLPVCFKITNIAQPIGIDNILEAHGYNHEFDISVQLLDIKDFKTNLDKNIQVLENSDNSWLDNYIKMNEMDACDKIILKRIINKINLPKCLFTLGIDGSAIGCGLGVVEDKYIGLFDIVIDTLYRNQGLGQILVENILRWGKRKGAEIGYLQVLTANNPAIKMYGKIGFREEYKYWYRIKR